VDLFKLHVCRAGCLADSVKEQVMTADKLVSDLKSDPGAILACSLETAHPSHEAQTTRLGKVLAEINAKLVQRQVRRVKELPVKPKGVSESEEKAFLSRLAYLEEKTGALDSVLAVRAAETYDLKEEAASVVTQLSSASPALFEEVSRLKQDTRTLASTLDDLKWKNDGAKFEVIQTKRMKTSLSSSRVHSQIRMLDDSVSKSDIDLKLKKLDDLNSSLTGQLRGNQEQVLLLEAEVRRLQQDKLGVFTLTPLELIECSHTIFSSYQQMKKKTHSTLSLLQQLDLKECPTFRRCLQEVKGLCNSRD
jgi:chromosome segregation ATPase